MAERMDIEKEKDGAIIMLREIEEEARQLIFRCANARGDLHSVKTEEDLNRFSLEHDLEKGFEHIRVW